MASLYQAAGEMNEFLASTYESKGHLKKKFAQ